MRKPLDRRASIIQSMVRMESWGRDRIAGDVLRAKQMNNALEKEHGAIEHELNAIQKELRDTCGRGVALNIDSFARMQHYLLNVQERHGKSEQEFRKSSQILDSLKAQLEKQALRVRCLERAEAKHERIQVADRVRHEDKNIDELILISRDNDNA